MPDEIQAHDEAVVDRALSDLLKHFDAAEVFVVRQDGDKTVGGAFGRGNWYSRYGIVTEWFENGGCLDLAEREDDDEPS